MWESLRRELRTYASHCDHSFHSLSICILDRHLHIILKVKKSQKYIRWIGPQPVKPFVFVTWPTVAGPQTKHIPYTKQSWASWEHWLGRIPCCCFLWISMPQQVTSWNPPPNVGCTYSHSSNLLKKELSIYKMNSVIHTIV